MEEEKLDRYILEGEIVLFKQRIERLGKKIIPLKNRVHNYKKQIAWREKYIKDNFKI